MGVAGGPQLGHAEGDDEDDTRPVAERLKGLVGDRAPKTPPRSNADKPPSETEWVAFLGERVVRWAMIGYVAWLTSPLDLSPDERARYIAPKDDRRTIASPLARLLSQSELGQRYGRKVLDADDLIDMAVVLAMWVDSTRPLMRARREALADQATQTPAMARQETPADESQRPGPGGGGPGGVIPGPWAATPGGPVWGGAGA